MKKVLSGLSEQIRRQMELIQKTEKEKGRKGRDRESKRETLNRQS